MNGKLVALTAFVCCVCGMAFADVPYLVNYQGMLTDDVGNPVTGTVDLNVSFYDAETGGWQMYAEDHLGVSVEDGVFHLLIGNGTPTIGQFMDIYQWTGTVYLEVTVDPAGAAEVLAPRQQMASTIFALKAEDADMLAGHGPSAFAAASHNHDDRYYTEAEIDAMGVGAHDHDDRYYTKAYVDGLQAQITAQAAQIAALETDNDSLASRMTAIETLLAGVTRNSSEITFSGVNVHIVNGQAGTETTNGKGNLIVGYNELRGGDVRTGSHNVVVGRGHNFSSYGGIVAGQSNEISGAYACVTAGYLNVASGEKASVSGGYSNEASGQWASVSGGSGNDAIGSRSSVTGGGGNNATYDGDSVTGGFYNTANGGGSSVTGGQWNTASDFYACVTGGQNNTASGEQASVTGGRYNSAVGDWSSVTGGGGGVASDGNEADASYASVTGGSRNTASQSWASVCGGYLNEASASYSTVSGGWSNIASGQHSSISGGRSNRASNTSASVSGGYSNEAAGDNASVSGGYSNEANGTYSTVGGGKDRIAPNIYDWVAGALFQEQ